MFQNAEVGVTLSGVKVAEGGCIIEGKAELSGVDIALLNEQQRAKLAIAYAIFVQATDAIYDHAEVISETYNSIADLYKGIAKKTQNLIDKLNNGQKITKRETKELEELKKQAADKMNKSADYFLKSLGNKGAQPILDLIRTANESCVCDLETEEVKKGPVFDDIFVNLEDCKKCLEEQKKKQEQVALLAKEFEKRFKSMKNKEMTCGCLSWGNFLQDISIIDGLTDCEEIVSIMNKAKADLSKIGSADFSVNNLFFDENKPTGQVSIGNTCIDNFSLKANPNSASIVVNSDKKTQYNDPAVEISNNNITITDYSNPGSSLVIGTDDNEQAKLVEKWLFEKILNVAKSSKKTDYIPPEGAVDVSLLKTSELGKKMLRISEGCTATAPKKDRRKGYLYVDSKGYCTFGIGHLIRKGDCTKEDEADWGKKTWEEALVDFEEGKLKEFEDIVKRHVKVPVTQAEFDAMISFAFNVGEGNGKGGKNAGFSGSSFIKTLNGDLKNTQKGTREPDLMKNFKDNPNRRKSEVELFKMGEYKHYPGGKEIATSKIPCDGK
jgi:GH24 family phage-related lysozyme (muramidase)